MKAATLTRASSSLAYSVMSSQGEPSWSKQRFLAVRVGTPAQALGLIRRPMRLKEILSQRFFPEREGISGWLSACYFGRIPTRAIENCVSHTAVYAR